MKKKKIVAHLSDKELEDRMKHSKSKSQYKKYHAIFLIQKKELKYQEISKILRIPLTTLYTWYYLYNKHGEKAIILKGRGGRSHANMSFEDEKKLLNKLKSKAEAGLIIVAKTIKKEAEKILNRKVCKNYGYDLLYRHGWRKVIPRPQHPKSDTKKQEEFKKISHIGCRRA